MSSGSGAKKPNFTYAALKHFYTKSVEEYFIKSSRGSAFANVHWTPGRKRFKFKLYFYYNKKMKAKVKLLKKMFNMTLKGLLKIILILKFHCYYVLYFLNSIENLTKI